jgi:flavocytochrome c
MINWHEQTDVVIVGSGIAGLSAAIEAKKADTSVIVFEKMTVRGGNTRISDGGLAAPGNYLQKRMGVEDSPERFYQDMLQAGLGLNHPHLVRIVAERAAEAIDWTRNVLGIHYLDRLDRFGGHSVARSLTTRSHSGADIIKSQLAELCRMGVKVRTRCRMRRLLTDASGAVCGVQIESGYNFRQAIFENTRNIRANRAVVLATGGFANDIGFRTLQNPCLNASILTTNHRGATAEGLIAALTIGAAPVHLSWIQLGPWGCADETGYGQGARFASYSVYTGGILVDPATGCRIVNEWADRRQRSEAIFKAGHACVGIVAAKGAETAADSLKNCLIRGKVREFWKLSELSAAYGMPSGQLETTVNQYNERVKRGERDPYGKPLEQGAQPVDQPPFYAIRLWPKVHYTPGGVGINSNAQVIDLHNRPIPRLFAAGEVCGGIHGASRLGSCALTECIIFGRIAGQEAAKADPQPFNSISHSR